MIFVVFKVLLTIWSIGFGLSVCMAITFTDGLKRKDGNEISGFEKYLVLTVMCVFWFVFFPKAIAKMFDEDD